MTAAPLSPATKAIISATVPALEQHGLAIVTEMYARLFRDPAIRALFNQSHQSADAAQPKALTGAVLAYARNIEDPSVLAGAIERIAQKHVSLQILPEHYASVAEALLGAIEAVLGEAATPEVLDAWGKAYWFLADVLIGREAQLYDTIEESEGGWRGWRDFVVAGREAESDRVMSFVLRPVDGGAVPRHKPGQYLALDLRREDGAPLRRNYSISCGPNADHYRITVKREPHGVASSWLHDHAVPGTVLRVAPPAGDFHLDTQAEGPIVLISGGVGLTPMLSMLEALPATRRQDVTYVHATQNGSSLVRGAQAVALAGRSVFFFEQPEAGEEVRHESGRVSGAWLAAHTPTGTARFYVCGPTGFMASVIGGLKTAGVSPERIRYEFFGPAADLQAA